MDGQLVSMTLGGKVENMALADIKSVEAGRLTLMQWLGWSGFLMWTSVGLLLAPLMLMVPARLVPFLLLVPTPWMVLLKNSAGRSIIVTVGRFLDVGRDGLPPRYGLPVWRFKSGGSFWL